MNAFDKLERKYGRYAIKKPMYYIIALYALGFVLEIFYPDVYANYLSLNAEAILHGQVWRIITFIIQPPSTSIFWIFFSLYMYYMIGTILENVWGSFRFNVYFFMGVILNVVAAIAIYLIFGVNMPLSTYYINLALFMAFATIAPDSRVLLFFIIPIKIKWLAYFDGIYIVATIIIGYLSPLLPFLGNTGGTLLNGFISLGLLPYAPTFSMVCSLAYINATAALLSMLNFFVFFLMTKKSHRTVGQKAFKKAMKEQKRSNIQRTRTVEINNNQNANEKGFVKVPKAAIHCCAVCHRTELDAPDLEFRFCSKCEGSYEYCSDHLYTHIHVVK